MAADLHAHDESGAAIWKLSEVSRHKSVDTLRGYVRRADLFKEHAGGGVPLSRAPGLEPGSRGNVVEI
jgi:hypothetical protein